MRLYAQFGLLLGLAGLTFGATESLTLGARVHLVPAFLGFQNKGLQSGHPNGVPQRVVPQNPAPQSNALQNNAPQNHVAQNNVHQSGAQKSEKGEHQPLSGRPGAWLEKYHGLPPDQQLRALENDPDFKNLPPMVQQELRTRLQKFSQRPPEEQKRTIERLKKIETLSPQQKQQVQNAFRQFRELPQDRQPVVRRVVKDLGDMSSQQRQREMQSDRFKQAFSDSERGVISNVLSAQSLIDGAKPEAVVGSTPPK